MPSKEDFLLRVDATGTVHPVGRLASQQLRARGGDWRIVAAPRDVVLMRRIHEDTPTLKLAGEIRNPGGLCDVVALVSQFGWRGELVVVSDDGQRSFYFDGGNVLGAQTSVAEERLGEMLLRFGVVTKEQLEAAVEVAESSNMRLGEAFIDLGLVKAEDLFPMMARQVEEVFYSAVHVAEGSFFFFDRLDESQLHQRHNLSAGGLLMEAARRMDEMKFFREKIPNDGYIPVPTTTSKRPPEELLGVFSHCDGQKSIADIGVTTGQLEFEITRAVFQLYNGGFVSVTASRPKGAEAIVETVNPAIAAIHEACDAAGKGDELREGLGRFAVGAGVYDPLFLMAGPRPDGTLKPDRVAKNLVALAGDDPDAWLIQLLSDYVGFALFQAESLVPREVLARLTNDVSDRMKPLRQVEPHNPPSRMP